MKKFWSGKRDSNSRPQPWQGYALPTELFPLYGVHYRGFYKTVNTLKIDWLINQHDAKLYLDGYLPKQCLDQAKIDEFHQLWQILWLFWHQHVVE